MNKNLPVLVVTLSAILFILSIIDWKGTSDKKSNNLWIKAVSQNTLESYQQYLNIDDKYQKEAQKNIVTIKQDKLNFKNAVDVGTVVAMEQYLAHCHEKICAYRGSAQDLLGSVTALEKQFTKHLEDDDLSDGDNGYALIDIEQLQQLVPNDTRLHQWSLKLSDKFSQLSRAYLKKKQISQAKKYLLMAEKLSIDHSLSLSSKALLIVKKDIINERIKLIQNDPDKLWDYFNNCEDDCSKQFNKLYNKAKQYVELNTSFNNKVKSEQLTNAGKDLAKLKKLFPKSEQVILWSKIIADGFLNFSQKYTGKQALIYVNRGLVIDPNHLELQELKKLIESKEEQRIQKIANIEKQQALKTINKSKNKKKRAAIYNSNMEYKKAIQTQTIVALRQYIDNCSNGCPDIKKAQIRVMNAEILIDDFKEHVKSGELLTGTTGYALLDLQRLKELFPKDKLIRKWDKIIIKKIINDIKYSMKRKRYVYAKKQLKQALKIYHSNKNLSQLSSLVRQGNNFKNSNLVPELVYIKGGGFTMGSKLRYAHPKRWVHLKPFKISKTEITFNQYYKYARAKHIKIRSSLWGKDNRPVINVNWNQANGYVKWLSKKTNRKFSLPSEAEWEFVARNSDLVLSTTQMNKSMVCRYANGADLASKLPWKNRQCRDRFGEKTAPVKYYLPNNFGVYDMHGNVWEWTNDCWHNNFYNAPTDNRAWNKSGNCNRRVIKGGGWNSSAFAMLPGYRNSAFKDLSYNYVGFRIVEQL